MKFNYNLKRSSDIDFGDYVQIEMFRYGSENEHYLFKVVGCINSNLSYCVPIKQENGKLKMNDNKEVCEVLQVIQCGVQEERVIRVRKIDVIKVGRFE